MTMDGLRRTRDGEFAHKSNITSCSQTDKTEMLEISGSDGGLLNTQTDINIYSFGLF